MTSNVVFMNINVQMIGLIVHQIIRITLCYKYHRNSIRIIEVLCERYIV